MTESDEPDVEEYRRRVAETIHDGPQQLLVAIGMRLQLLEQDAPPELSAQIAEIGRQAEQARAQLRSLMLGIDDQR